MSEDDVRGPLARGDWDGITRAEAVRLLLEQAEADRHLYSPMTWWRRLVVLVKLWVR